MRGRLTYHLFDLISNRRVIPTFDAMVERQSWDRNRLARYAADRLQELLRSATDSVPYYRRVFDSRSDPSLSDLPILTKETLRAELDGMLAPSADRSSMRRATSGGSTGEPVTIWFDRGTLDAQTATVLRHQLWMDLSTITPHALLWGPPPGLVGYGTLSGRLRGLLLRRRFFPTYDLDDDRAEAIRRALAASAPTQVIGYSSALDRIAAGTPPLARPPRAVVASAEILYPAQRRRIEAFFRAPLFERYGCNEFATLAHQCRAGALHVNSDRVHLEILNPDGTPTPAGGVGEAVVTDLDNRGMPLIRFRLGDALESGGECSCGLPFPVVGPIHGRIADLLPGRDGGSITPRRLAIALEATGEVLEHQVKLRAGLPDRVDVRVLGAFDRTMAEHQIRMLFGSEISVRQVERLDRWPSGKTRSVLRMEDAP